MSTDFPALSDCLLRDRHRFSQRLKRLRPQDTDRRDALHDAMRRSAATLVARRSVTLSLDWPDLPVVSRLDELRAAIDAHQVVVVAGETGSGKTTQLPKICLDLGRGRAGMIGHTQPRRLAARAVAARLADEVGGQLGEEVGVQVRFQEQLTERTLVKVMTDGILLAEIQQDRFLNRYDTLIIDEAHERSLNIDFLLGYLRQLLPKRPDLKVIITSATIDHERFATHFGNAPVIEVSGRTFPVTQHYRPADDERELSRQVEDVLREIEATEREHGRPSSCDVLVFLSGERDIRDVHHHLRRCQFRDTEFLPLYARLSRQEQQRVFSGHRGRRVVLATNVAETSLTVPGIRYVIDAGTARISRYSVQSKVQRLPIEPISQASANQRAGRCGRIMPGDCYRLYSEDDFLGRPAFTDPEIQRTNLASVILRMADLKFGSVDEFPFIDPPEGRLVRDGYRLLEEIQALAGNRLTDLGRRLARFPLDPRLARMLFEAERRGALNELLVIVSALAAQDPRERPQEARQAADQAHQAFVDKQSDFLFFLNLWQFAEEQRGALSRSAFERLLKKHFLSPLRMREWREVHTQLLVLCRELKMKRNSSAADYEQIHRSLLVGLLSNVIKRTEEGEWLSARNRKPHLWPGSALGKSKRAWLVCAELVETSRLFARTLAGVEADWVEAAADHLVKRRYLEPHWSVKRGSAMAKEQVHLFGLMISAGKRVNYARINPQESRELMIREGLVCGQLREMPEFVRINRASYERLEALEHKLRRRDLLADEEAQVAFYQQRLPEQLLTLADVLAWHKRKASTEEKQALLMADDFLLQSQPVPDTDGLPDHLECGGVTFPLEYQFHPDSQKDGVIVRSPAVALSALSETRLAWLVPALLRDKLEQLLRGLPKAVRRNFVPVPDYVDALMAAMAFGEGDLFEQMTRQLQRMTGVRVEREQWLAVTLPDHLVITVRVLDGERVLAEGSDLQALSARCAAKAQSTPDADAAEATPVTWATDWPQGPMPTQRSVRRSGIDVTLFPALVQGSEGVRETLFSDQAEADYQHRWGLARLALLKLGSQSKALRERTRKDARWRQLKQSGAAGKRGKGSGGVQADLPEQALLALAADHFQFNATVRDAAAFAQCLDAGRGEWLARAESGLDQLAGVIAQRQQLEKQLGKGFPLAWAHVHRDLLAQLDGLFRPDWLLQVPMDWQAEYPRYLKAIAQRLEKVGGQLGKDRAAVAELEAWQERLQSRAAGRPLWRWPEPLLTLRFMLEEYRVSLFAQSLGTRVPVSAKRLRQQWEQC